MDPLKGQTTRTRSLDPVSTKLQRIANLARDRSGEALNNLAHHIDIDWLREAYRRTRKDGATGIDGQSAEDYAANLDANLQDLLDRAKSGSYVAPPVKRVLIPKGRGREKRPIGIPTFEDKILQRAVSMVLEAVYEQDFLDCSWGFRPSRSAHGALESLWQTAMKMDGWVLEIDIRRFFDTLSHSRLREVLCRRVRDGVLLRLIGKWLKAGVLDRGQVIHPQLGTPQGGVISPLLANIYLHEVIDRWFMGKAAPNLGPSELIRYADDAVFVFRREVDAKRVLEALPRRLAAYELELHPDKTRLVDFRSPRRRPPKDDPGGIPRSFDFLGFTHYWARTRRGKWAVTRRTAKDRFSRAVHAAHRWCRRHRHLPVRTQHCLLSRKLRGHYAYYGITGNGRALQRFRFMLQIVWKRWLNRRSQRNDMPWDRFNRVLLRYPLPPPRVVHSAMVS